jgi:hypothetical protein
MTSQLHSRILLLPTHARPILRTGSRPSVGLPARQPGGPATIRQQIPGSAWIAEVMNRLGHKTATAATRSQHATAERDMALAEP